MSTPPPSTSDLSDSVATLTLADDSASTLKHKSDSTDEKQPADEIPSTPLRTTITSLVSHLTSSPNLNRRGSLILIPSSSLTSSDSVTTLVESISFDPNNVLNLSREEMNEIQDELEEEGGEDVIMSPNTEATNATNTNTTTSGASTTIHSRLLDLDAIHDTSDYDQEEDGEDHGSNSSSAGGVTSSNGSSSSTSRRFISTNSGSSTSHSQPTSCPLSPSQRPIEELTAASLLLAHNPHLIQNLSGEELVKVRNGIVTGEGEEEDGELKLKVKRKEGTTEEQEEDPFEGIDQEEESTT